MATSTFMPIASTLERTRIEPGEYPARCTAVKPPELYTFFARWFLRIDFAVHDGGEIVSRYLNLGKSEGKPTNIQLGPRSEYYKLWTMAVGRKPEKNEPMDPAKIVGVDFLVTVADKEHGSGGGAYSRVESVRREPVEDVAKECLLLSCSSSTSATNATSATCSTTTTTSTSSSEEFSGFSIDEIPPRGPLRWELMKRLKESEPEKLQSFLRACKAKDAADLQP
jgi:hypothetical protein